MKFGKVQCSVSPVVLWL